MIRFSTVVYVCIVVLGLGGCREEKVKDACRVDNARDLPWLPRLIADGRVNGAETEVTRYTYKGETVYLVDLCAGCADYGSMVYNCQGDTICQFSGFGGVGGVPECLDFSEAVQEKVIWRQ
jgi:hypothetical protein